MSIWRIPIGRGGCITLRRGRRGGASGIADALTARASTASSTPLRAKSHPSNLMLCSAIQLSNFPNRMFSVLSSIEFELVAED